MQTTDASSLRMSGGARLTGAASDGRATVALVWICVPIAAGAQAMRDHDGRAALLGHELVERRLQSRKSVSPPYLHRKPRIHTMASLSLPDSIHLPLPKKPCQTCTMRSLSLSRAEVASSSNITAGCHSRSDRRG